MSLKRPRIHLTGISNIDYKTKEDIQKVFNNFKNFTIKPKEPEYEEHKDKYKAPKPKSPNMYNVSLEDVKEQSGDSLMYADTYNFRKELKRKKMVNHTEEKLRDLNSISHGYNSKDLKTDDTKDLNKSKNEELNERIKEYENDKERIQYLRNCVKKKLFPHKDIKNLFLIWQRNYLKNQELSAYDLHQRINELNIPITYNEAIGLINYANKRNTNSLNFDEFNNLFFVDRDKLNELRNKSTIIPKKIDINKIKDDNKKELEDINSKFLNQKTFKHDHFLTLETILQIKNSNFIVSMNEINDKENNKNGVCDFPTFKKVLDTLKIPEKYKNKYIAKSIFNEFKVPDKDLMNYTKFLEKCNNFKQPNDFFEFQNNYLNLLSKKMENNETEREKYKHILLEEEKRRKEYIENLVPPKSEDRLFADKINYKLVNNNKSYAYNRYSTIKTEANEQRYKTPFNKEINENNNINSDRLNACTLSCDRRDTFSHYQPSLNFINLVFKDSRKYTDRYEEGIRKLRPIEIFQDKDGKFNHNKSKDYKDFGGYFQRYKKTYLNDDKGAPGYIDEKERFIRNDICDTEKKIRLKNLEIHNKNKLFIKKDWNDRIDFQQKVADVKESLGQIKRTRKLYEYENRIIERNKLH